MSMLNSRPIIFAFNCTIAALLSLYIGFSLGLSNPWWAALTVFITSQPMAAASGAVVARALYRVLGTIAGMAAALIILPGLANAPELLIVAVAAWVAVCLYMSLIDRTPRGYAFMLAGYTLALIGLPLIGDPSGIFDTAVVRCEEIAIGAVCAATMHCLVFPKSTHASLVAKVDATAKDARGWISAALPPGASTADEHSARSKLAADLAELESLAALVGHEIGGHVTAPRVLHALGHRLAALLPLLTGVEDRLHALGKEMTIGDDLRSHLAEVRQWVMEGAGTDRHRADRLVEAGQRVSRDTDGLSRWSVLLTGSLLQRVEELVRAWDDSLALIQLLHRPEQTPDHRTRTLLAETRGRQLHLDHGLAAYSGFAAAIAVILAATLAVATGWTQGAIAVGIAAAGSSVFAFVDDPRPLQQTFIVWTFVAAPVAALYSFAILPAADGFVPLALVVSPLFFATAYYLATPRWLPALGFALISQTLIALQPTHATDLITFATASLASIGGAAIALTVTSLMRVIGAETSSWRILQAGWRDLDGLAAGTRPMTATAWVSRMLDRVALLLPRLPRVAGVERFRHADALNDLRLGVNVAELRDVARSLRQPASRSIDLALTGVSVHVTSQKRHRHLAPDTTLLRAIDGAIDQLFQLDATEVRRRGLVAATGLRRSLFPDAPPYRSEESVA